ncbi:MULTISPECIES: Crp/Fnr family transcriptional regulator [Desulfitobacterium]|uniref:cAMP-binding protein n=1 Tax=Desulfitobacterium dehalogenans (strain ATCC 51507 / DSM 9161 / JW/IU-DC1) TaxID=756499 RepID=I4A5L3_DESDJ|nr:MULTISPECIES: Crp/Fnr family transcriptional regulator [Desulfitobacterium]AFL99247.1 cAMP-binding protein [Desulfitobacterium dehalogenans ATCC 51507]
MSTLLNSFKYSPFLCYECPQLASLAHQHGEKVLYPKHHIILTPEMPVHSVYYIEQGRVRYVSISPQGDEHIWGILTEDSFFGLIPILLLDPSCGVFVITETPTTIYKIEKDCFLDILNTFPEFNLSIIKGLAHFGNELLNQIESLLFYNNRERLLELLLASIDKENPVDQNWYQLKIQYTQEDIGKIIGATRITVTRLISELCKEEVIRMVNHKIEIKYTDP